MTIELLQLDPPQDPRQTAQEALDCLIELMAEHPEMTAEHIVRWTPVLRDLEELSK